MRADCAGLRIAVAGATSYLASRLAPVLVKSGAQPLAIIRAKTDALRLGPALTSCDPVLLTQDPGILGRRIADAGCSVIINCIGDYGRNGRPASRLLQANVAAPLLLAEAAEVGGVQLFVSVGSALPPWVNLYSLTKAQFVDLARMTPWRSLRVCNARCEIFFGPDEPDHSKLPTFVIQQLAADADSIPLSGGEQQRDFMYVDDLARALAIIVQAEVGAPPGFHQYDVGSGKLITIRHFAETARTIIGAHTELQFGAIPYRPNEIMSVQVDPSRLFALGWSPTVSLEEAIQLSAPSAPPLA